MKLGRSLTWDAANRLLHRPYNKPWKHPEA